MNDDGPNYCCESYPKSLTEGTSNPLGWADLPPFHIGQSYEDHPARPVSCARCGGAQFHVAQGNFFTAIRCPVCGWELCIHDG